MPCLADEYGTEIQRVEDQVYARIDRLEREVREEIRTIKDTLAAQAVTQGRNETILASLVAEVKSFRTEFMSLLTASIQAQTRQNNAWHETAIRVVGQLLAIAAAAYGLSRLAQ